MFRATNHQLRRSYDFSATSSEAATSGRYGGATAITPCTPPLSSDLTCSSGSPPSDCTRPLMRASWCWLRIAENLISCRPFVTFIGPVPTGREENSTSGLMAVVLNRCFGMTENEIRSRGLW